MPRRTLDDQRYAFRGRNRWNQWPRRPVWGDEVPGSQRALDRWIAKRQCDQGACPDCRREGRISRIRSSYSRRRR